MMHLLTFFLMNSCGLINPPLQLPWTLYRHMNIRTLETTLCLAYLPYIATVIKSSVFSI